MIGGPKYDGEYLKSLVERLLGNLTVSQALTDLVVPTFDLKRLQPVIFTAKDVNTEIIRTHPKIVVPFNSQVIDKYQFLYRD